MFYLPVKIVFGTEALESSAALIGRMGSKAFLVTGRNGARLSGALEDVTRVLKRLGIDWQVYDRIEENPAMAAVIEGAKVLARSGCDFLIGIGGGSPIDAAKAIGLAYANQLSREELFQTEKFKRNLPLVAIPTTSGTGTETTQYSVLTDLRRRQKAGFGSDLAFPALAVCDPRYTLSLGEKVTLHTAIDALSHLLEGIYSKRRETLLYPLIRKGVKAIVENLPTALSQPGDLPARTELMRASLYGGMTIAQTSTTLQHSIGYPLTSNFGVPHGLANGIVMKRIMELYRPAVAGELDSLFRSLELSREDFFAWLDGFGLKTGLELTEEFIEAHIEEVMNSRNMANNPLRVEPATIAELFRSVV